MRISLEIKIFAARFKPASDCRDNVCPDAFGQIVIFFLKNLFFSVHRNSVDKIHDNYPGSTKLIKGFWKSSPAQITSEVAGCKFILLRNLLHILNLEYKIQILPDPAFKISNQLFCPDITQL